jgi:hypothetical protein
MDSSNLRNLKRLAAVVGGGAVIAAGAMTMAIHQEQAGPETVAKSQMTVGSTTTETTPPNVEATSMAVPTIKGPAPLPSEQKAAE